MVPLAALTVMCNGTFTERTAVVLLLAVFFWLAWFDFSHERLNQPEYVYRKFGINLHRI
jgi:hypothetical protein